MNICELFLSIDGEGIRTGDTAVFIRKTLCNLHCSYCDSAYTFTNDESTEMSIDEIVAKCNEIGKGCKRVTYTGGEPLFGRNDTEKQEIHSLLNALTDAGYEVNVETNGAVDLAPWLADVRRNGFFTMDWKSIGSGMSKFMLEGNLALLNEHDVLKFVVGSKEDLDQMKHVLSAHNIKAKVYVSPVFGNIEPVDIVNYIMDNKLHNVRVQLQLHKYIWNPNKRGV